MREVYSMGFDAWHEGQPQADYLADCERSPKYGCGKWFVLEHATQELDSKLDISLDISLAGTLAGTLLSALVTYEIPQTDGKPAIGIGSVSTPPMLRNRGYASRLLAQVIDLYRQRDANTVFFLHSDIAPRMYEALGFVPLPERLQTQPGTVTMILSRPDDLARRFADPNFRSPDYF